MGFPGPKSLFFCFFGSGAQKFGFFVFWCRDPSDWFFWFPCCVFCHLGGHWGGKEKKQSDCSKKNKFLVPEPKIPKNQSFWSREPKINTKSTTLVLEQKKQKAKILGPGNQKNKKNKIVGPGTKKNKKNQTFWPREPKEPKNPSFGSRN